MFYSYSREDETKVLNTYFPDGYSLKAKYIPDSNVYKLLFSFAQGFLTLRATMSYQLNQFDVRTTTDYLEEYEKMLGVGSSRSCFSNEAPIERRKRQVRALMAAIGLQTCSDLVRVIKILGYDITCTDALDVRGFPYTFPVKLAVDLKDAANTVIINIKGVEPDVFPYTFPVKFADTEEINTLKCFIESLVPVTIKVLYEYGK